MISRREAKGDGHHAALENTVTSVFKAKSQVDKEITFKKLFEDSGLASLALYIPMLCSIFLRVSTCTGSHAPLFSAVILGVLSRRRPSTATLKEEERKRLVGRLKSPLFCSCNSFVIDILHMLYV